MVGVKKGLPVRFYSALHGRLQALRVPIYKQLNIPLESDVFSANTAVRPMWVRSFHFHFIDSLRFGNYNGHIEFFRCEVAGMTDYTQHAKVFKALSEPKRAMIVEMLSCGELCACMILEKFNISQSTLSHHMKLLRECRLVKVRNEGKWTYYSLDAETIRETAQFFHVLTSAKENCICQEEADGGVGREGCDQNE